MLEECWRPSFARYLHVRFTGLKRDLEQWLDYYDFDRVHNGRLTRGRIPRGDRLRCPQGEDEMSRECRHISVTVQLRRRRAAPER
jgi:hypothetical protein